MVLCCRTLSLALTAIHVWRSLVPMEQVASFVLLLVRAHHHLSAVYCAWPCTKCRSDDWQR